MDKFLKYMKEREGLKEISNDHGFLLYKFLYQDKKIIGLFISDYFVLPEFRRKGVAYKLADKVFEYCKAKGIKTVFCQSDIRANNHKISMLSILNFGFDILKIEGPIIHYFMEVDKWEMQ